uniref:Uncharacterized protein n=1 Tax=Aplanochytrium stocchinoi TaxID=215587 RepID=A0A7S3LSJ6_9STRA|mmetsp:Transcript_7049/g.8918  ORF Transcript_7049/g.8918 Transcript_7049/m.8918 type:complete len:131 (-) Transcript_7049:1374-1766(-)|eukprot:CAMPEP_0204825166 /NCGR_PEP_ID=MMETSP1346-20131115/3083_1 /ASSEMBLY_ACC=CAM_ASM_000771 /TAXON_ID=215587 /ORGANISM="Aplanochytrium stocchinoi, Strain GSBS06" /LENGTH=130 /DNA_ID=CAMNT_0051952689 /DNA_START=411 /DNA_END=803 /DNA_ORIENTATION=-
MGNCCASPDDDAHEGLGNVPDASQPVASEELPPGWKMVPSRSRPGKVSYQNIHTGERISWVPKEEAKTYKGGITKTKKKRKKKPAGPGNIDTIPENAAAGQTVKSASPNNGGKATSADEVKVEDKAITSS